MAGEMNFERPLKELRDKIQELRKFGEEKGIDFSDEMAKLEERAARLADEIYHNLTAWQKTQIARYLTRPTTTDYIGKLFTDFIQIHGDRVFGDDPAIVGGIGKFEGRPVTVIGHQKGKDTKENIYRNFGMPHPEGYRKALRLMEQAEKFRRPIICFIDTPGAYPGMAAEERGQSEAIARNLREMAGFTVPIVCIVTGEGGSGGALALSVGNRLFMLENSFYSVITPEGAATILWKDASKSQTAAEALKYTAQHLRDFGIVDGIIPEPRGGAHNDLAYQAEQIRAVLSEALNELDRLSEEDLVEDRYQKFRQIGKFSSLVFS